MRTTGWAFILLLSIATTARADAIRLGNGDILQGTIVEE